MRPTGPGRWLARVGLLLLLLAGANLPAAAQTCPSADGAGYTYVYPVDNPGNLNAGQSLLIQSGTYTGNLNGPAAGALVCVNAGATFQPATANNMAGTLQNHGTSVLDGINFAAGATFNNYGSLVFDNTNANGGITIVNADGATIEARDNVTIPSGSTVTNDGVVDVEAGSNLDIQGSSTVVNNGSIDLNGDNITLSGTVTNNGFIEGVGVFAVNGGSFTNGCSVVASTQIFNNGSMTNNGFMMVTAGAATIINNGAATLTQSDNAVMSGVNFQNQGTVTGGGRYHFTATTVNQGPFSGTSAASPIVFYDTTRVPPPEFFDTQNTNPTNTVRISFEPPTVAEALANCSPDPIQSDVSVTKQTPLDAIAPGGEISYSLVVDNHGPDGAEGTLLTDDPDDALTCTAVTCTGSSGGATCPATGAAAGQLSIDNLLGSGVELELPANGQIVLELTCTVDATP